MNESVHEAEPVTGLPPIERFAGEFAWLSNMFEAPCSHAGLTFKSSEHLYQWLKTAPGAGWWRDRIFNAPHGKVAKAIVRNEKCPKAPFVDWTEFRLACMKVALRAKFDSNPDLRQKLIATAPRILIEGNYWRDHFWGVCNGTGLNNLGLLLMELRSEYLFAQAA
ncbi:NADAR family protein [Nevskia ramosa]|uniref:NADAR family protein n=1 Tax=Nevskia ramosa TaxID=64002 RepID=UPI002355537D|nr:NADAR family protein [Nevskia ramosa]